MKLYTIEKNAMKAVKSILTCGARYCGVARDWMQYAYLYENGLIMTDGVRLLRIHDAGLEEEFSSFIKETGRVVLFSLEGNSLKMEHDLALNDSKFGMMERLIPSKEKFEGALSKEFSNHFTSEGKAVKPKDISKSMINAAILSTQRWFDPDRFEFMGCRPWARILPSTTSVTFISNTDDEFFIVMGTRWEGV